MVESTRIKYYLKFKIYNKIELTEFKSSAVVVAGLSIPLIND